MAAPAPVITSAFQQVARNKGVRSGPIPFPYKHNLGLDYAISTQGTMTQSTAWSSSCKRGWDVRSLYGGDHMSSYSLLM